MRNIVFVGMPAVGKSTIGVLIAKRLGYQFIDTDLVIQEQEGRLLREIIDEMGIDGFLQIEDRINCEVKAEKAIISPGGSIVYCKNAMEHYRKIGTIVYLQASFETIRERIGDAADRGVILREGQTFKALYDERTGLFEHYAHITVCQDYMDLEQSVDAVLTALGKKDFTNNKFMI